VVAIGDDVEATPLTVASLQNLDAKRIIMSTRSPVHEHILWPTGLQKESFCLQIGAATRPVHSLLFEKMVDSLSLSEDHTIAELRAPDHFVDTPITELEMEDR